MRRPNVLIIYTDQQRWDALGANGNAAIQTPNLDRLAAEGVNFDHCFVQNPVCMPSRASMLTGRYPSALGITHMGVPVPGDTVTLPRMVRNYGYFSANIGKLHFLPHANRDHREVHPDYGFDQLEISDEPGCYEDAYRAWVRRIAPDQLDNVSVGLPPAAQTWQQLMRVADGIEHPTERFPLKALASRCPAAVTHSAFVAEQTMEFIRGNRDRTWLQIAGFYSPHSPWVAPREFLDRYDPDRIGRPDFPADVDAQRGPERCADEELRAARHGYYAVVSEVDHHVGRILTCLDETGVAENTIVIFTSDHGEWLGEHLRYGKGHPGDDCVSRVPLIIRWPGGDLARGTTSSIVEAVDIVPTILDCAGVQSPVALGGTSLLPLLTGRAAAVRDSALMEATGWKTLRTDRWRYRVESDGTEALFDLAADPREYVDVSGDPAYAEALADLRHRLLHRLVSGERPLAHAWPY